MIMVLIVLREVHLQKMGHSNSYLTLDNKKTGENLEFVEMYSRNETLEKVFLYCLCKTYM